MIAKTLLFASLVATSAIVSAQTAAPTASTPQAEARAPAVPEKKVCRSEVALGSIMAKRVCHTKAEWAQIHGRDAKNTDRYTEEKSRNAVAPQDL